jgi:hypothetical protein
MDTAFNKTFLLTLIVLILTCTTLVSSSTINIQKTEPSNTLKSSLSSLDIFKPVYGVFVAAEKVVSDKALKRAKTLAENSYKASKDGADDMLIGLQSANIMTYATGEKLFELIYKTIHCKQVAIYLTQGATKYYNQNVGIQAPLKFRRIAYF